MAGKPGRGRPRTLPDAQSRACLWCGDSFTPPRKFWQAKFCTRSCSARHRVKSMESMASIHARLSGESRRGTGTRGYVKFHGRHMHRVVAERAIGRPLRSDEIVHHKDGNKHNNDPGNLEVLSRSEHCRVHDFGRHPGARRGSKPHPSREPDAIRA